eukprot:1121956-Lingulodinium_polyedra.AAC.1
MELVQRVRLGPDPPVDLGGKGDEIECNCQSQVPRAKQVPPQFKACGRNPAPPVGKYVVDSTDTRALRVLVPLRVPT